MYHPLYGLDIEYRLGRIEFHHLVVRRARERRRLAGDAQGDAHIILGGLRVGKIDGGPWDSIEIKVFDIADNANDFPMFILLAVSTRYDPLSNGVLIREKA